jgi:DNA-binding IclR family transcriptional regulator
MSAAAHTMVKQPKAAELKKPAEPNTSYLDRVFMLLRYVADVGGTGARVPDICKHLGIHRVSAHRLLKSLLDLGYVEQAPDLSYHLGIEAWSLGVAASRRFIPSDVAAAMKRVSDATEECVFLMRRTGNVGLCIGLQEGTFPVRSFVMRVGTRRHLGIGGTSTAILAALPSNDAERIIKQNVAEYAPFGLTAERVRKLVAETRQRGYAYSRGIVVPEARTVAVPLPLSSNSATMMSMSIVTLESRLLEPRRTELVGLLRREAAALQAAAA